MRLFFVHADRVAFEATTAVGPEGDADEPEGPTAGELTDCVAAFVGVESADAPALDAVVSEATDELRAALDRLNASRAFLSPTAHLVDDPADAEAVRTALRGIDAAIDADIEVLRAPVGWHAALDISAKGHPFARRSVRVDPADARELAPSEWRMLGADGELTGPDEPESAVDGDVSAIIEAGGTEVFAGDRDGPRHVDRLREHEIADRDGTEGVRWLPRGVLIRDALAAYAASLAGERGATPVETPEADGRRPSRSGPPVAFDPDGAEAADRPLWRFDPARETPELRAAVHDPERAREAFRASVALARRAGDALGLDCLPVVRATRAFYDDNEAWVAGLAAAFDGQTIVELLRERRGAWSIAVDLVAVDAEGRAVGTASVRLDDATPGADESDDGRSVWRVRCAPVGRLDRTVEALVASAAGRDPPGVPTWLAPTQVRLVPVDGEHVARCEEIATALDAAGVRVDVDDRAATVGERLANAAADWVPYYAVVGDRERGGDALDVTVGAEAAERELTVPQLRDAVLADAGGKPTVRLSRPRRIGERFRFPDR